MKTLRYVSLFAGAALLAGCMGVDVEQLNDTEIVGDTFTDNLAREYRDLANFEAFEMQDWADADYFAQKGLQAAAGQPVDPAVLANWNLPADSIPELTEARGRLVAALNGNARSTFPVEAAIAQSRFDCWVEQQEENHQPDHIAACRDEFYAALAIIEGPVVVVEPMYLVFFDWDRYNLTPDARDTIAEVADVWQAANQPTISVVGFTDTSGPRAYNLQLSLRRAASVEQGLIGQGVPGGSIVTDGQGEDNLRVPTPDGVREPANRRAEITFMQ
jgi:OOP family OmpA-OmpF porin